MPKPSKHPLMDINEQAVKELTKYENLFKMIFEGGKTQTVSEWVMASAMRDTIAAGQQPHILTDNVTTALACLNGHLQHSLLEIYRSELDRLDPQHPHAISSQIIHQREDIIAAFANLIAKVDEQMMATTQDHAELEKLHTIKDGLKKKRDTIKRLLDPSEEEKAKYAGPTILDVIENLEFMAATPGGLVAQKDMEEALAIDAEKVKADKPEDAVRVGENKKQKEETLADFLRDGVKIGKYSITQEGNCIYFTAGKLGFSGKNREIAIRKLVAMAKANPGTGPGNDIKFTGAMTKNPKDMQDIVKGFVDGGYDPEKMIIEIIDNKGKKVKKSLAEYFSSEFPEFVSSLDKTCEDKKGEVKQEFEDPKTQTRIRNELSASGKDLEGEYKNPNADAAQRAEKLDKLLVVDKYDTAAKLLNDPQPTTQAVAAVTRITTFNALLTEYFGQLQQGGARQQVTLGDLTRDSLTHADNEEKVKQLGNLLARLDTDPLNEICPHLVVDPQTNRRSPTEPLAQGAPVQAPQTPDPAQAAKILYCLLKSGNGTRAAEIFSNLPHDAQTQIMDNLIGIYQQNEHLNSVQLNLDTLTAMGQLFKGPGFNFNAFMDQKDNARRANIGRAVATALPVPRTGYKAIPGRWKRTTNPPANMAACLIQIKDATGNDIVSDQWDYSAFAAAFAAVAETGNRQQAQEMLGGRMRGRMRGIRAAVEQTNSAAAISLLKKLAPRTFIEEALAIPTQVSMGLGGR